MMEMMERYASPSSGSVTFSQFAGATNTKLAFSPSRICSGSANLTTSPSGKSPSSSGAATTPSSQGRAVLGAASDQNSTTESKGSIEPPNSKPLHDLTVTSGIKKNGAGGSDLNRHSSIGIDCSALNYSRIVGSPRLAAHLKANSKTLSRVLIANSSFAETARIHTDTSS